MRAWIHVPTGKRRLALSVLVAIGAALALLAPARSAAPVPSFEARYSEAGVAVDLEIVPVENDRSGLPPREGDLVTFRFRITDAAGGAPFGNGFPVAWVDRQRPFDAGDEGGCRSKIRTFLEGNLFRRADLDLNEYTVLLLHDDATISAVDPRFGFGGTKLLSLVQLAAPGADWALTEEPQALFVSMPAAGKVAVLDPARLAVTAEIDTGGHPEKLLLQPDEGYLWATGGSSADESSVTVLSTREKRVLARFGRGAGALAVSDDNRTAFLTQPAARKVQIIDIASLEVVREVDTGARPRHIAYSGLARSAYVALEGEGGVIAIDADRREITARIATSADPSAIETAPGGRLAFVLSTAHDRIEILDTSSNRILQRAEIPGGPDQILFSETLAYVRLRSSENVHILPLDGASVPGARTPAGDFPAGEKPPGPAPAAKTMTLAPGGGAMLVANANDNAVYYYKEGMAAPMGHFSTYGRPPRGVLVLDHSLRERSPGVYETTARLGPPGKTDVAFVLDSPRTSHCFAFEVSPKTAAPAGPAAGLVVPELAIPGQTLTAGQKSSVRVQLRDPETGALRPHRAGAEVLVYLSPGIWQARIRAEARDDGSLAVEFPPPSPGVYSIVLTSLDGGPELSRAAPHRDGAVTFRLTEMAARPPLRVLSE
ncbi:MAG: hypothetical protein R3B70_08740 [Polyangiaceae bacterium]